MFLRSPQERPKGPASWNYVQKFMANYMRKSFKTVINKLVINIKKFKMKSFSTKIMVIIAAMLLSVKTYSQTSIDSLVIKIFETWGYDITNYKPGTTPIKLDYNDSVFPYGTHLKFVPSPIFVNVSSDTIFKTDSLGIGFVLA